MGAILVTGAGGYLGRRVLAALTSGPRADDVVATVRPGGAADVGVPVRPCELTDRAAVAVMLDDIRPDAVVHTAAQVPKDGGGYVDEAAGAASLAMVEALVRGEPRHVVFASSMTVYAADAAMPVKEEDAAPPSTGYAGAKRRAELVLEASGRPVTVLRLPGLFGPPRRGGLIYQVVKALVQDEAPRLPASPPLWAAMHIDDAAALCTRAALASPPDGYQVLNAGYGDEMWIGKAVNLLAGLTGRAPLDVAPSPPFAFKLSRLEKTLGLPDGTLEGRLAEVVDWVRKEAA